MWVFIFDNVEVLDFAGPFEVFSRTRLSPGVESRRSEERVVRDDNIITSAGVAAGIHMALTVVEILHGKEVANDTARYLEFPRTRYSVALTDDS